MVGFRNPELGTGGQARALAEIDQEAQGVAAAWLNLSPESIAIDMTIEGMSPVLEEWAAAEKDEQAARDAQARAAQRRRAAIRELRTGNYTGPEVAAILGISKQRVHQIEKSADVGKTTTGQKVAS